MKYLYPLIFFALTVVAVSCIRESVDENCRTEVQIPVRVDWSQSGITPGSTAETDYVNRVSLRFFPEDGSPAFDRYLEGNVYEGAIGIPVGRYAVIAFNEGIDDVYWESALRFTDVNDYHLFAANIAEMDAEPYDFHTQLPGESFITEPLKLASWNLDYFEVTPDMRNCTACAADANSMFNALTKILMRRLVAQTNVVVEVTNLKSAMRMEGALAGTTGKVYMASAQTEMQPSTHLFTFTAPVWSDETKTDGLVERRFWTFGRLPQPSSYSLNLGVVLVTGNRHQPEQPMKYDVTDQVLKQSEGNIYIKVKLSLPLVEGGVGVGEWDDEEHIIQ